MSQIIDQATTKFKDVLEHLRKDLSSMRAGRANPQMLDNIKVDVYSQLMPIVQVANITVVDASLLTVKPWDKSTVEAVTNAIKSSDIGIQPIVEGEVIKLPIPPLTEERRLDYVKVMKSKLEEARIAVRQVRKELLDEVGNQKDSNNLSEDDAERLEKQVQKLVDETNESIETIGKEKEKELMQV
ncbi:MAG: ribosome recycling factor [Candidatus Dojkabacteria bacterium]|nr:MAG: ribosome recycling factor [Candidatus Dojkabacteria bacterium]